MIFQHNFIQIINIGQAGLVTHVCLLGAKPSVTPIGHGEKCLWKFIQITAIFIQENAFETLICTMVAIL